MSSSPKDSLSLLYHGEGGDLQLNRYQPLMEILVSPLCSPPPPIIIG